MAGPRRGPNFGPMALVLCPMSYGLCPTSYILCPTSYVLCSMSCVLRPMSYVLCHMPYVLCPMSYVLCPMSSVLCPVSYALCPMSDVPCPMSCVPGSTNTGQEHRVWRFRGSNIRQLIVDIVYRRNAYRIVSFAPSQTDLVSHRTVMQRAVSLASWSVGT